MAKEYFPQIGKIPFEGTESKNVMAFHYYDPERMVMGTHCAEHRATSLAGRPAATSGTRPTVPYSAPRIRWMPVSR